ncbi:hypothetical protein [Aliagarivorans taiwanensis]|uniref:hypothetical protein n=1 Tax=Aliagarivorans taiwanensis TaxID=561966 RepID=UPI0012FBB7A3|nr:hypothetical protein [Aliagarivorans taiwanensis]
MMLLQTLNELDNYVIDTPGMVIDEWAEDTHGRVKGFHATVTTPRSITLEEVCASHDGPNKGFDLVGVVAGNLLNISLEHPQRPSQNVHIDPKHAVLLIDITALSMAMADNKRAFLEIMLDYVACHAPRRWISHPRMAQAKQKLARDIAAWKQTSRQDPAPARESRPSSPVDWSMVPAEHDAYCLRCRVSMGKVSRWCPTCFMPVSKRPG